MRHITRRATGTISLVVALTACGPDNGSIVEPEIDVEDTTAPTVATVHPSADATGVSVGTMIEVTFSESIDPISIRPPTFSMDGVPGVVSVTSDGFAFDPHDDLEHGTTYTATVGAGVMDMAGNVSGTPHTWSFTTESAPAPPFGLSISPGQTWSYDLEWNRTVVGSSIGVERESFTGWTVLYAPEQTQWQGRTSWRLMRYDIEAVPGENAFTRTAHRLYVADDGIDVWVPDAVGGRWRQLLSTVAPSFTNNHFLLAGDPRGPTTEMDAGQVDVPAGSFATVRARVQHSVTGRYAPEDIFETRTEHWVSGVGIVRASWDFSFDDNDPSGWDVFEAGAAELLPPGGGPVPVQAEVEQNDGPAATTSQRLPTPGIVEGRVFISDAGAIVSNANVYPNVLGEARIQDWYRLVIPPGGAQIRIDLDFDRYTNGAFNDLDLYLMAPSTLGPVYVGRSTAEPGEPERLDGFVQEGTYYLGVQAWNTPTSPVGYAILVR